MAEKFTHKLGISRKVERSRIWLEGGRLTRAGFTHGKSFSKTWNLRTGTLILKVEGTNEEANEFGTVAGTPERPIIDIVGEQVRKFFASGTHVEVKYHDDKRITVRRAR